MAKLSTLSISANSAPPQTIAATQGVVPEKLEETSQTYGQCIVLVEQKQANQTVAQTTQAIKEGANQANTSSTAEFTQAAAQVLLTNEPVIIAADPILAISYAGALVQQVFVNPVDTLVTLIANTPEATVRLGCKTKATISMAAASSNGNATVTVNSTDIIMKTPQTLEGSILNSIATVVPNTKVIATVLGSSVKSQEEIRSALTEAQKIDLSITLRSKRSESIEFNTIKKPRLQVDFVYNFFTEDEEEVETQEDQKLDPLLKRRPADTPRYANLTWAITQVTEPLAGTEQDVKESETLRRQIFSKPRGKFAVGTHTLPFSAQSSVKDVEPFVQEGLKKEVADIHNPEKVFASVANDGAFANSVSMTLNVSTQNKVISEIPFKNISK